MENLTKKELKSLLKYWKSKLGLQDWDISISISRHEDMKFTDSEGENTYQHVNKLALIKLLDVVDYTGCILATQDQEKVLVHELLHCVFSSIDTENAIIDRMQHQIIETMAKALIQAKRGD